MQPRLQVWGWAEGSEVGRELDILAWSMEFLLARYLPVPTRITDPLGARLVEWSKELEEMSPSVLEDHEVTGDSDVGPSAAAQGPTVTADRLPPACALSLGDLEVLQAGTWDGLSPDEELLLLLRMAITYRADYGRPIPAELVDRCVAACERRVR